MSASDDAGVDGPRPLRLEGRRLYVDRYWRQECTIADRILGLATRDVEVDEAILAAGLERLFGPATRAARSGVDAVGP